MQYAMTPGFNYEPTKEQSIEQCALTVGLSAEAYAYDAMMADEGTGMIYFPLLNYVDGNLDFLETALDSDDCVNSLSDGGAHCGTICDAAATTFMLQHWVRDRARGRIPLERAIKRQCRDTAQLYGFLDRGVIGPGYLADLNVIDLDSLALNLPSVAFDCLRGVGDCCRLRRAMTAPLNRDRLLFGRVTVRVLTPGGLFEARSRNRSAPSPQRLPSVDDQTE